MDGDYALLTEGSPARTEYVKYDHTKMDILTIGIMESP